MRSILLTIGCLFASTFAAGAQQSAPTDQVDRTVLPLPTPPFNGVIGKTYKESKEDWPKNPTPPAGAPNIVVILLDDVGFGQTSTFGGPVQTPELDKLAAQGLRYTRFHTTAICGPSRAALLTGGKIPATVAGRFGIDTFGIGEDTGAPVSNTYKPPFAFTGKIDKVDFHLGPTTTSASDQKILNDREKGFAAATE
jgi:Sulfatase